ncbi:MAG: FkbM family methyltransferase, partial [Pseudomonadota bacterium]
RLFWPTSPIEAFEANPVLAERLERRMLGDAALHVRPFGLSDREGAFTLYLPRYRGWAFDGLASTDREAAVGWLRAETIAGFDPALLEVDEIEVELRRLDDLGLAPVFVKIDVQGLEAAVLEGGRQTLTEHRPLLLVERGVALPAFLDDLGYSAYAWREGRLSPTLGDAINALYATPDHLQRIAETGR